MRSDRRSSAARALLGASITVCALVLGATAVQEADAHVAPSGDGVLVPGARDLTTSSFGRESESDRIVSDSGPGTAERTIGSAASGIEPATYQGHAALLFTKTSRRGAAVFVDTALVLRDGLVPVWEVASNSRGWHARFDYDGATVRVDAVSPDSTHRATHAYAQPVFNFNELDAIVRAVPLRDGYHSIVALYSEGDDAVEMDTISVSAPHGGRAWDVRFADRVIISHYAIDGATRRITGLEVTYHKWPMRVRYLQDSVVASAPPAAASVIALARAGATPSLLAPGRLSTSFNEWNTSMTPDERTVFFSRGTFWTIMMAVRAADGTWSMPEVAPFSGLWMDTDPFVSPDGARVYFVSNRPLDGNPSTPPRSEYGIWYASRTADGGWSTPVNVGAPINGRGSVWFPSVTRDGTLYFHTRGRSGARGGSDIYAARWTGHGYAEPTPLEIDTSANDQEPYVAPDGSYLVFVSDRSGGEGGSDLWISRNRDGRWQQPSNLGPAINGAATEMAPAVSPDGATLYFTSNRRSEHGVRAHRVDAAALTREMSGYDNGSLKMYAIAIDSAALHAADAGAGR